jgi:acetylglutamate synthase
VVASPEQVNKTIGTTMQHMGVALAMAATPYLPIENAEVKVPPQPIGSGTQAVLLTNRMMHSDNSSLLMVNWEQVEGNVIFDVVAFRLNELDLARTGFVKLVPIVEAEVRRQIGAMLANTPHKSGSTVVNMTLVDNYFPVTPAPQAQEALPESATDLL